MGAFSEFCAQTSLHGWVFVGDKGQGQGCLSLKKTFWFLVILGLLIYLVYLLNNTLTNFGEDTIKVDVEDRAGGLEDVYFPSIAICNVNPIRYEENHQYITYIPIFFIQEEFHLLDSSRSKERDQTKGIEGSPVQIDYKGVFQDQRSQ